MESNMSHSDQCLDQRHILQLNDDCFYEIYKFLPPMDWCSLRETCTRLRTISDYWFERQYERFYLRPWIVYGTTDVAFLSLNDSKRLIRNFGQFMTTLSIDGKCFIDDEYLESLIRLIDRYCIALRNLSLLDIDFGTTSQQLIVKCNRLFSNLHRLVLHPWSREVFPFWMARCTSLKELKLCNMKMNGSSLDYWFESLESVTMERCGPLEPHYVRQFFAKNQKLKEIKLLCNEFARRINFVEDVVVTPPNLESLSMTKNNICVTEILPAQISALRNLELDLDFVEDDSINRLFTDLAAHNSVENVFLLAPTLSDSVVEHLCKLKTVQTLKLSVVTALNGVKCTKLARELRAVSEIHLYYCDGVKFNQIREFVIHSVNLQRIFLIRLYHSYQESLTTEFMSLVEAQKKKNTQEILLVFLEPADLVYVRRQFEIKRMLQTLSSCSNVIKLLPLN